MYKKAMSVVSPTQPCVFIFNSDDYNKMHKGFLCVPRYAIPFFPVSEADPADPTLTNTTVSYHITSPPLLRTAQPNPDRSQKSNPETFPLLR